jgi:hypothetical protein
MTNVASDKRVRLVDIGQKNLERNVSVNTEREISGVVIPTNMVFLSTA